jgi:hypothetical protein
MPVKNARIPEFCVPVCLSSTGTGFTGSIGGTAGILPASPLVPAESNPVPACSTIFVLIRATGFLFGKMQYSST